MLTEEEVGRPECCIHFGERIGPLWEASCTNRYVELGGNCIFSFGHQHYCRYYVARGYDGIPYKEGDMEGK